MKRIHIMMVIIFCLIVSVGANSFVQFKKVREAYVAGQFYPADPTALTAQLQEYLQMASRIEFNGQLHAIVVPHAGYIYSGPIAAYAYKQITTPFKRVVLFASNHSAYADVDGASVPDYTHYATPLGEVSVSPLVRTLLAQDRIAYIPEAHTTHIIEVQLPFLQTVLPEDFEILPVITGRMNWDDVRYFAELFNQYVDNETLFVLSTDLSHYHSYDEAVRLDTSCTRALETLDTRGVINSELCGQGAALILLEIAKKNGWQGKILDYRNSGDTAGDKSRVVGYAAVAYYQVSDHTSIAAPDQPQQITNPPLHSPQPLSHQEQKLLLELARTTLEQYLQTHTLFEPDPQRFSPFPALQETRGTFVTLKKQGELRGCIGNIIGKQPLYLGVRDHAINAAVHDSRFLPVKQEELTEIDLSISVLDVPRLLRVKTPEDYLEKLTHQDGVLLASGTAQATYLPQVWEQLPDPVEFLSRLCLKAGAQADCWKDPETLIYTYHAQEFAEE
ncbi:AMMECR1 domain protein [Candidatus Vecturithrix granuli]|uniref:AMMECR1 domain protein n=1 Tax=Vecturithrix granuli TaxID=1499967 RepID=A0A081C6H4_VECG1|nr:AMMECR1 domain protein [Candidatus Vecturithrix granuli]